MTDLDQHTPSTGQPVDAFEHWFWTRWREYMVPEHDGNLESWSRAVARDAWCARDAEVESLQQRLAAAQAERDRWEQSAVGAAEQCVELRAELDSKRAVLVAYGQQTQKDMVERDQLRRENKALRGAMREALSCARTVLSKLRLSDRPPYAELVALQNAVETAAAIDAASAGQPKSNG